MLFQKAEVLMIILMILILINCSIKFSALVFDDLIDEILLSIF